MADLAGLKFGDHPTGRPALAGAYQYAEIAGELRRVAANPPSRPSSEVYHTGAAVWR